MSAATFNHGVQQIKYEKEWNIIEVLLVYVFPSQFRIIHREQNIYISMA